MDCSLPLSPFKHIELWACLQIKKGRFMVLPTSVKTKSLILLLFLGFFALLSPLPLQASQDGNTFTRCFEQRVQDQDSSTAFCSACEGCGGECTITSEAWDCTQGSGSNTYYGETDGSTSSEHTNHTTDQSGTGSSGYTSGTSSSGSTSSGSTGSTSSTSTTPTAVSVNDYCEVPANEGFSDYASCVTDWCKQVECAQNDGTYSSTSNRCNYNTSTTTIAALAAYSSNAANAVTTAMCNEFATCMDTPTPEESASATAVGCMNSSLCESEYNAYAAAWANYNSGVSGVMVSVTSFFGSESSYYTTREDTANSLRDCYLSHGEAYPLWLQKRQLP